MIYRDDGWTDKEREHAQQMARNTTPQSGRIEDQIAVAIEQVRQKLAEKDDRIATLEAELKDLKITHEIVVAHACDNETRLLARAEKAEAEVERLAKEEESWRITARLQHEELFGDSGALAEVARLREALEEISRIENGVESDMKRVDLCVRIARLALATRQEEGK